MLLACWLVCQRATRLFKIIYRVMNVYGIWLKGETVRERERARASERRGQAGWEGKWMNEWLSDKQMWHLRAISKKKDGKIYGIFISAVNRKTSSINACLTAEYGQKAAAATTTTILGCRLTSKRKLPNGTMYTQCVHTQHFLWYTDVRASLCACVFMSIDKFSMKFSFFSNK